jgi:hypothetical protein
MYIPPAGEEPEQWRIQDRCPGRLLLTTPSAAVLLTAAPAARPSWHAGAPFAEPAAGAAPPVAGCARGLSYVGYAGRVPYGAAGAACDVHLELAPWAPPAAAAYDDAAGAPLVHARLHLLDCAAPRAAARRADVAPPVAPPTLHTTAAAGSPPAPLRTRSGRRLLATASGAAGELSLVPWAARSVFVTSNLSAPAAMVNGSFTWGSAVATSAVGEQKTATEEEWAEAVFWIIRSPASALTGALHAVEHT